MGLDLRLQHTQPAFRHLTLERRSICRSLLRDYHARHLAPLELKGDGQHDPEQHVTRPDGQREFRSLVPAGTEPRQIADCEAQKNGCTR